MVPAMIPAGALNQVSAAAAASTGAVSGQPSGETVFRAQVHVDKEK